MILNALNISHEALRQHIKSGAKVIDATCGNGGDTLFLLDLVGEEGFVTAFDIQEQAISNTLGKLSNTKKSNYAVYKDSHANLKNYFADESVDAIVFNFGWLPGGDHNIFTHAESSLSAIRSGLDILKVGGIMSLCVYYGRNNGYGERDSILDYISTLDYKKYTVITLSFANRVNDPPFPVFIIKES